MVTSNHALRNYPDRAARRLSGDITYDVRVADHDPDELRRAFGRAMRKAARDPSLTSSGNNKRVTFLLAGPGAADAAALEAYLAADDTPARSVPGRPGAAKVDRATPQRTGTVRPPSSKPRRQGYLADAAGRKAIEDRAMGAATIHWTAQGFDVQDVSGDHPYDLQCTHPDGRELRVEVKGTTGTGRTIHLTVGEVAHARERRGAVALFLLHGIELSHGAGGPVADGGTPEVETDWDVDAGTLRATRFDWRAGKDSCDVHDE